jgi:hypothetical protein
MAFEDISAVYLAGKNKIVDIIFYKKNEALKKASLKSVLR